MVESIDPDIVRMVIALARERGSEVAVVPLTDLAGKLGISRATLFRRIGSRARLHEAVRAAGIDPGERPDVRERAVLAAAAIIRRDGLGAVTLERVAAEANCSVPALHSQLGGREGLLAAVFERFSPLPPVEQFLMTPPTSFPAAVRAFYGILFDALSAEPDLLAAFLADTLARPQGPTATVLRETFLPRVLGSVGRWLATEVAAGRCRSLPLPILLQLLSVPLAVHVATRDFMASAIGVAFPARAETIELFAAAYCRAVALPPPEVDRPTPSEHPTQEEL